MGTVCGTHMSARERYRIAREVWRDSLDNPPVSNTRELGALLRAADALANDYDKLLSEHLFVPARSGGS